VINKLELPNDDIKVLVDNHPVDNISEVSISLFNATDQDFDDVLVDLIFSPIGGKLPALIQPNVTTSKEFFSEVPWRSDSDGLHVGYNFKILNRNTQPALLGNYFFLGATAPELKVFVIKKGLSAERLEIGKSVSGSLFTYVWVSLLSFIGVSILFWSMFILGIKSAKYYGRIFPIGAIKTGDSRRV